MVRLDHVDVAIYTEESGSEKKELFLFHRET